MLHQRILKIATCLLLLLSIAEAQNRLVCAICRTQVSRGYEIQGQVYCQNHYGQALPHCSNCGVEIQGDYQAVGIAKKAVCLGCLASHPSCFMCSAPADPARGGLMLVDGRALCGNDKATAVTSSPQAHMLFEQAALEVQQALGNTLRLKVPVKEVKLVDVAGLIEVAKGQYQLATLTSGRVLGLTTLILKSKGRRRWTEPATVYLLSCVPAERMLTVCAHEYAHVWHAENHPDYSTTTSQMREGFAEWVAYKVAQHSQRHLQVAALTYSGDDLYSQSLQRYLDLERVVGVAGVLHHAISAADL